MPLDSQIALGGAARAPAQQDPLAGIASLMQLVHMVQQNKKLDAESERLGQRTPLELELLRAQTANTLAQAPEHAAKTVTAQLAAREAMSQAEGRARLLELINPKSAAYTQFEGGPSPQMFNSSSDALRAAGYQLNENGSVTKLPGMDAARAAPFRGVVPNQSEYNMALTQALPAEALKERIKALNPTEQYASATPGSQVYNRRTGAVAGPQVPFAERVPQRPQIVPSATGIVQVDQGSVTPLNDPSTGQPLMPPSTIRKPPTGYRFSENGETLERITGGPKDDSAKPLPSAALRLQQNELEAIGTAASIKADMSALSKQIDDKKLDLGLIANNIAAGRNFLGLSSETSKNYASFRNSLEKLRNDSLRLNKGVQTEGDAQRAWNELISNLNDSGVVKQRLGEIQNINDRAIEIRRLNVNNIRKNYGAEAMDFSGYDTQPAAVGNGGLPPSSAIEAEIARRRGAR